MTVCRKKHSFNSMYLDGIVTELKDKTLCLSLRHNGVLFDALTVNHDKKEINLFRSSLKPNKHKLDLSAIRRVMGRLRLFDEANKEYRINYFYCFSKSSIPCGYQPSNKENLDESAISEIQKRFKIFICRIKIFQGEGTVSLG